MNCINAAGQIGVLHFSGSNGKSREDYTATVTDVSVRVTGR
jgi:hypothetical protein